MFLQINNTQIDWSLMWKCHVPNYNSEWMLLVISFVVLLTPFVFYFMNWILSKERSNILLFRKYFTTTVNLLISIVV